MEIRDVLIDGTQPFFLEKFRRYDGALQRASAVTGVIGAAPRFVVEAAGMVLIAFLALFLMSRSGGLATAVPVLGALALGAQRLLPLMQLAYFSWAQVLANLGNADDVLEMLETPIPDEHLRSATGPLPFTKSIAFRDVSFRVLGRSGAGAPTSQFYHPEGGEDGPGRQDRERKEHDGRSSDGVAGADERADRD